MATNNIYLEPFVSIVIPCRNEESSIADCVNSILRSKYPDDLIEIFVCNSLSTDRTPGIVQAIAEDHSNVKLLKNDKQTTPHARNLGLEQSNGEIIIILDAHAAIDEHYVSTCVASLTGNADVGCVGGLLDNTYSDGRSQAIAWLVNNMEEGKKMGQNGQNHVVENYNWDD